MAKPVRNGSNRAVDPLTPVDLARVIKTRFNVTLAERGAGTPPRRRSRSGGEPVDRTASR